MKTTRLYCVSLFLFVLTICPALAQEGQMRPSFRFTGLPLSASLDSLMRWFPASIVYLDDDVEGISVTASCSSCGFEEALNTVLRGTRLTWIKTGNQVILMVDRTGSPNRGVTVCGTVVDSVSGEPIAAANVMVPAEVGQGPWSHWCPTNSFGFFSMRGIGAGKPTIVVRAVGYRAKEVQVAVHAEGNQLEISLVRDEITMPEVTVEGQRTALASADGFSRGLYIRAAPTDQTQYFLDGGRIYNPAHYGGVLTSFNEEALTDVDEVVGGIPPSYGGRIGGILDLSLREGTRRKLSGSAWTGSLG